jgi:hydrogenase assembly chaperone HypC/HupF
MCLAIPGKIISINNNWAEVEVMGVLTMVNIQLIEKPQIQDCILIHAGCAIQRISTVESLYLQSVLAELSSRDDADG